MEAQGARASHTYSLGRLLRDGLTPEGERECRDCLERVYVFLDADGRKREFIKTQRKRFLVHDFTCAEACGIPKV